MRDFIRTPETVIDSPQTLNHTNIYTRVCLHLLSSEDGSPSNVRRFSIAIISTTFIIIVIVSTLT